MKKWVRQISEHFVTSWKTRYLLKDLKEGFTYEKATKVYALMDRAESSWNFITREIAKMNDDERQSKALEDFKNRVSNAANVNDNI